jgi:hypothetical protein
MLLYLLPPYPPTPGLTPAAVNAAPFLCTSEWRTRHHFPSSVHFVKDVRFNNELEILSMFFSLRSPGQIVNHSYPKLWVAFVVPSAA